MRAPVIAVDFDGTLVGHAWPGMGEEMPGGVEAVRNLVTRGARVFVFSVRVNTHDPITGTAKAPADYLRDFHEVRDWLDARGLEAVDIHVGNKPLFDYLIDDRALRFTGRKGSWKAMYRKVEALVGKYLEPA